MDEQKILMDLLEDGTIGIDDISDADVKKVALRMKSVKIPKVSIRKHKDKCYYNIKVPEKYSSTGKRYTIYGESEQQVIKKFKKAVFEFQKEQDETLKRKQLTVAQLVEMALKESIRFEVKNSSYTAYYQKYESYILPSAFGSMPAIQVDKTDCQKFINSLCNGIFSNSTVTGTKTVLNQAFKYGIDQKILERNYMSNVKVKAEECRVSIKDDEDVVYTRDELLKFCQTATESWQKHRKYTNAPILPILCLTGLRIGELIALKWEDVDFEKRKLYVTKTYSEQTGFDDDGNNTHKKVYTITPPKKKASIRSVVLCDAAIFWLKELRKRYEEKGRLSEFVLATKSGKHPKHENIQTTMKRVCNAAGIEYKALHACRRAYVSVAIDEGMTPKTVSKQVGHKNVTTTLNIYNKYVSSDEEVVEQLNDMYDFMN